MNAFRSVLIRSRLQDLRSEKKNAYSKYNLTGAGVSDSTKESEN